jgi:hypothetical protein
LVAIALYHSTLNALQVPPHRRWTDVDEGPAPCQRLFRCLFPFLRLHARYPAKQKEAATGKIETTSGRFPFCSSRLFLATSFPTDFTRKASGQSISLPCAMQHACLECLNQILSVGSLRRLETWEESLFVKLFEAAWASPLIRAHAQRLQFFFEFGSLVVCSLRA